jgi:hypothetical protein
MVPPMQVNPVVPMVPRRMEMPSLVGSVVLSQDVGRASLERSHEHEPECEGNGEQQCEQANRSQQERELPSMGAAVAECGRSLSA